MNTFYIPSIFYYFQQFLFTFRVSSLLSPLNDASGDIVDDEGSCQIVKFLLKLNSHHPCDKKLKQNQSASQNCYNVKNTLSIQMPFKQVIAWNRMFHLLIWWFGVRKNASGKKAPWKNAPEKIAPRKIAPQENCFTRLLLLLTLSYSSSFSNFL